VKRLFLAIGLCLLTMGSAWSATRYVTDQLQITLRSGPTTSHRILRMVDAGVPLQVMAPAQEGWVLERHLMNEPSARDQLGAATNRLQKAQQELADLKRNLSSGNEQLTSAQTQIKTLSTDNERMSKQLEEAARGLTLANENRDLKKQIVDLGREIDVLQNEARKLSDRSQRDWFVVGALVVSGGFLVGILVTRIRWRKKSSWSSL
jgi:SH3 domain protein